MIQVKNKNKTMTHTKRDREREREPAKESRRVDFPEPDGPIIAMILPGSAYPLSPSSNLLVCPLPK